MIKTTPIKNEKFKGSAPSVSPTAQNSGVFSLCSGGVPFHGSLSRLPGKVIKVFENLGGVIQILAFGKKVAIQYHGGLVLYDSSEIFSTNKDFVTDNDGNLVTDNFGIPITT